MFNKIRTKLVVAFLLVVLVPLVGTTLYGNWVTSRIISERAVESARNDVRLHAEQIASFLNHARGDVLYLSRLDSLQYLLDPQVRADSQLFEQWRTQVMQDFLIFSASRPMYYQVRYLAEDGQEIVRIDSVDQVSHIIRRPKLQTKAHRYYFQETMLLPRGGIYVSALDLNRENGIIEVPHTPVMRYSTPVFDEQGHRRGAVIINIYAASFLDLLREGHDTLLMVNQDGYYLAHSNEAYLWGGPQDLITGKHVLNDYFGNSANVLSGLEGDFTANSRVVVYTPLYPVASDRDRFWVVMRDDSAVSLFEPVADFRVTAVAILSLAILIAFLIALTLSHQLIAPILALRKGVDRFGQGDLKEAIPVQTRDEIGQLTLAFNKMAATIRQHLDQLNQLTIASQKISSGLDRQTTLNAILETTKGLFSAEYCAISITTDAQSNSLPNPVIQMGDETWKQWRQMLPVVQTGQQALNLGQWQATQLDSDAGYFCCAPVCVRPGKQGLIELYGYDPALNESACGSLLFTLAVEASIALENSELYEELGNHKHQLEELIEQLIDAQEAERKYVAYDLHDGLIQYLVGARLQLSKLTKYATPESEKVLAEAMTHLTHAVQEGRRVIEGLRPTLLDNLGLGSALNELSRDVGQVAGWDVTFQNEIGSDRLPPAIELTAFRVAQEALNNVRKHAQASQVTVSLVRNNGTLSIAVRDNGKGFDRDAVRDQHQNFGLVSMRERAMLLGGTYNIMSRIGAGTMVAVELPVEEMGLEIGD